MKTLAKILRLDFLPRSADLGLLVLRVWIGTSMLVLHGWGKLTGFSKMSDTFLDLFGIGSKASLALAIFGEFFCSALLILGLFTRLAALGGLITMLIAFAIVHKKVLSGAGSGELAFIYLASFVTLFLSGPGRISLDANMGGKE